jgi:acetoin:2,6-dichlorophenolindophenol oxidoreductase subunit beta
VKTLTFAEAVAEGLAEEMRRDPRVFVCGEDVGYYDGAFQATKGLFREFGGGRVIDMPISEAAIVGAAYGAALAGLRPVAEVQYVEFFDYIDPLVNHVAKTHLMSGGRIRVPMVIRLPNGGKGGNAGPHSQSMEAWFLHVPGLRVAMPSNPRDAKGLLKAAIRGDDPTVFIEDKLLYFHSGEVPEEEETIPFGKAAVPREGRDLTIVALGWMVGRALAAAKELAESGIDVEVVDPRTLNPLDMDTIVGSVRKTGRAIVTHQACRTGGVGAEISARLMETAFDSLDAPVERVTGLDAPIAYDLKLEKAALPSERDLVSAARRMLGVDRP